MGRRPGAGPRSESSPVPQVQRPLLPGGGIRGLLHQTPQEPAKSGSLQPPESKERRSAPQRGGRVRLQQRLGESPRPPAGGARGQGQRAAAVGLTPPSLSPRRKKTQSRSPPSGSGRAPPPWGPTVTESLPPARPSGTALSSVKRGSNGGRRRGAPSPHPRTRPVGSQIAAMQPPPLPVPGASARRCCSTGCSTGAGVPLEPGLRNLGCGEVLGPCPPPAQRAVKSRGGVAAGRRPDEDERKDWRVRVSF